jgi:acetyl-CoA carboxylase biotin carboxylase subunit
MFSRILIANRGEIALRVIRACRELGIESVCVYSKADATGPWLRHADHTICIGEAVASDSYLNIPRIISAAEVANVDAIHPGYGFLSENAHFAEVCRDCKIEFIGPSPEAMALLGDKVSCKRMARDNKVPIFPGSDGAITEEATAVRVAAKIGYPVIIKASAGGGGRGMRVAHNEATLKSGLKQAANEAEAAFGNGAVYIEKFLESARHIEVQVVGDKHGAAIHLWERDCSTQRRHQKLIEESPAPGVDQKKLEDVCKSAARLIKGAKYSGAATVEFLMDERQNFYMLEVNTRLQVEHPVTELVTGIDLVKLQILVASGQPLPFRQKDITKNGAAIECRINAEDPKRKFQPSPGKIERLIVPGGFGVRFDSHAHSGYVVPPYYDSMIGKLIVHQPTREQAVRTMLRALAEMRVDGIKTTIPLHQEILSHSAFMDGRIDTTFVERTFGAD